MEEYPIDAESALFALSQSWEVHRQAFGPIIEPAFADNKQVRVMLINALNHISRREVERGLEILKEIRPFCDCDEDMAAWTFFIGVAFEMGGAKAQMVEWYEKSCEIGHSFYLPYLKLAKDAHGSAKFERAIEYYKNAIECIFEMSEDEWDLTVLGSAYTNMTSCFTMLHRYDEAMEAWESAQKYTLQPGSDATAAILYAAMGNREKTNEHIEKLKKKFPMWLEQTKEMTDRILDGTHPAFPR